MIAFADMMRKQIVMPAHLMNDNEHMENNKRNLFKDFSSVAQATGTYTGQVDSLHPDLHRRLSSHHHIKMAFLLLVLEVCAASSTCCLGLGGLGSHILLQAIKLAPGKLHGCRFAQLLMTNTRVCEVISVLQQFPS